jgi:acyl-CoA reductase-like NAD-dependent aldehyde dehydrogenase
MSQNHFAHEKLSPTLAMYRAKDFEDAVSKAEKLVAMGGIGHTSCLYTDQDNQPERVALLRRQDEDRAYPDQHPCFSGWDR